MLAVRLRRRRALSLAIGWFTSLVLGGTWTHKQVFWWPAFGTDRPRAALLAPLPLLIVEELLGLAAAYWVWTRFGLADATSRPSRLSGSESSSLIAGPLIS